MTNIRPATSEQVTRIVPFLKVLAKLNQRIYHWSGGRLLSELNGPRHLRSHHDRREVRGDPDRAADVRALPRRGDPGRHPKDPQWVHNLVVNPVIEVQYRSRQMPLRARRASAAEKAELWPVCCQHCPDYEQRTDRDIPVFIREPC